MCTPEHVARIAARSGQPVQPGPMGGVPVRSLFNPSGRPLPAMPPGGPRPMGGGSSFQPRPMFGGRTEPPAGMAPRNTFFSAKPSGSPIRDAFRP